MKSEREREPGRLPPPAGADDPSKGSPTKAAGVKRTELTDEQWAAVSAGGSPTKSRKIWDDND